MHGCQQADVQCPSKRLKRQMNSEANIADSIATCVGRFPMNPLQVWLREFAYGDAGPKGVHTLAFAPK